MRRPRVLASGLVVAAFLLPAGCANPADQDLCGHYAALTAAVDNVRAVQPQSASIDELRAKAETVLQKATSVQASWRKNAGLVEGLRRRLEVLELEDVELGDRSRSQGVRSRRSGRRAARSSPAAI